MTTETMGVLSGYLSQISVSRQTVAGFVGVGVTLAVCSYGLLFSGSWISAPTLLGGVGGGFAAGVLLGTNPVDGIAMGFKVGALGGALASLAFGGFLLILWFIDTGLVFANSVFTLTALYFFFLAPLCAFLGAIGGGSGVALRRFTLPRKYNPPSR